MKKNSLDSCKELISIIVPIYNAEPFLSKCLFSIIQQTYRNIEIILVDDGSTDKSGRICDEFAKYDNRIKVLHEENGGVSIARNKGLLKATGGYCAFVDSDDWITNDCIEQLYNTIKDFDMSVGGIESLTIKGFKVHHKEDGILMFADSSRFSSYIYGHNDISCPFAKLFRMDIIRKYNLLFNNSIKYGEDALFVFEYLYRSNAIAFTPQTIYKYNRININSATTKYYESVTDWIQLLIEARIKLFAKLPYCDEATVGLQRYIVFWMNRIIKKHVEALDKQSSINAIKYTYDVFSGYMNREIINDSDLTFKEFEEYRKYQESVEKSDFQAVYNHIYTAMHQKKNNSLYQEKIIPIMQKIIVKYHYGIFNGSIVILRLYLKLKKHSIVSSAI